jgi:hypothetical protein
MTTNKVAFVIETNHIIEKTIQLKTEMTALKYKTVGYRPFDVKSMRSIFV